MACGEADLACFAFEWLRENEFAAGVLTKFVAEYGEQAGGVVQAIAGFVREHGEKIIAAAGFSFGVWRWWVYREHILHKRLEEYLSESDGRLKTAAQDVLTALERPSPGRPGKMPLFAPAEMVSVLRERNWDRSPTAITVQSSAQWQLRTAIEKIERRLKASEAKLASLRSQLATAHVLSGAISSASAKAGIAANGEADLRALTAFRTALQVPGHDQSLLAKELEAHQLRKLGHYDPALEAFEEMEELAGALTDHRTKMLAIARSKLHRAEILQFQKFQNSTIDAAGARLFAGGGAANVLLIQVRDIRAEFAPFGDWEQLAQGDIHYFSAFVANKLKNPHVERRELKDAGTAYRSLEASLRGGLLQARGNRKLRRKAQAGVARVERAQSGDYDWRWLSSD